MVGRVRRLRWHAPRSRLQRLLRLEGTKIADQVAGALIADHGVGVIHAGKDLIPFWHLGLVIEAVAEDCHEMGLREFAAVGGGEIRQVSYGNLES